MAPYFSVIVPVYKVEEYLRRCVDSILGQTFADFELILVDDGSPDGCPAICDEYAARDGRVSVIHKANGGPSAARKAGLEAARADYVCFADGDDYVVPEWLETIRGHIEANGRPDMLLFGFLRDFGTHTVPAPPAPAPGCYDKARLEREIYPRMLYDRDKPFFSKLILAYIWAMAGKRELWLCHFAEDDRIRIFEDGAMVFECLYFAQSVYVCPECLYIYLQRDASLMHQYHPNYISTLAAFLEYVHEHLGRLSADIDEQLNAYIVMRTISAIVQEFAAGHSIPEAARNVRREMNAARLPQKLRFDGLPLYIRAYVLLLKCRLYLPAAWITKRRMPAASDG